MKFVELVWQGHGYEYHSPRSAQPAKGLLVRRLPLSEKGEVLLRGVGTLRYVLILSENSARQAPICAVAA